ncbi:MAG: decaprenyl-phosphate phosphoribosyltransferase [Gammaproteobacteria bacterium]|nr:decaprenyl-phosphate phosphoribosyltransferase [Rhodocyclaceae bacterium]MBU3910307.1 decaprenyl-phosphate phosphoribosyltransferase [Gammaproteobacteria bacterium]MBU3990237.1 decaprenyl-phosphate phosphoribosyltransferase [Gammaproteobacteria bacterium]MBU4004134.1 decaprenyl-phosphate phosphoribosyltransferase [Gammaproteobacteria bacterium]MBU4020381.1 decaprenyl-phosphate phosphoribosyltransferase [Gammaproteobacteria bacterium]
MHSLIRLMRIHQWVKNGFVFAGLLFSHSWSDPDLLLQGLAAFIAFCLISSAVYVMNDLVDREQDRRHPEKRHRPLASGAVSVPAALVLAGVCLLLGLGLALGLFAPLGVPASQAPWVFVAYFVMNVAYSLGLKHVVVLDVFIIATGFMLRLLAGTLGLSIWPSHWLLLCGLMLTLFLGFAKRRAELNVLAVEGGSHRPVLDRYTPAMLDQFTTLSAGATVMAYSLYTVSDETIALHGTPWLIVTVPCVLYGLLRYLYRLHHAGGGDPARELLTDPHLLAIFFIWLTLVVWLLA